MDPTRTEIFKILRDRPEYKHYSDETLTSLINDITDEFIRILMGDKE